MNHPAVVKAAQLVAIEIPQMYRYANGRPAENTKEFREWYAARLKEIDEHIAEIIEYGISSRNIAYAYRRMIVYTGGIQVQARMAAIELPMNPTQEQVRRAMNEVKQAAHWMDPGIIDRMREILGVAKISHANGARAAEWANSSREFFPPHVLDRCYSCGGWYMIRRDEEAHVEVHFVGCEKSWH